MKSPEMQSGAGPAFRLTPHSKGKALVGVAAVVAMGSFAFMVFGPLADQRVQALAVHEGRAAEAASAPPPQQRLAQLVPRGYIEPR